NVENKSIAIVKEFLKDANTPSREINKRLLTDAFWEDMNSGRFYTSDNWQFTSTVQNDSTVIVSARGQTVNGFGRPIEIEQRFGLTNKYGKWQIFESCNFIVCRDLDFRLVDTDWWFYWDRQKIRILKHLQDNLKLEVVVPGYHVYNNGVKGRLRLVNNSDYDITGITILIEHFDSAGRSINTDHEIISDYIRKGGYREFDWYTSDCAKSCRQTFKINFLQEE
ncbi:MAG: hypothetical protein K2I43_04125, partial [Alistipes sp.]|nr:hypothetical protein [Alistipes sp.]